MSDIITTIWNAVQNYTSFASSGDQKPVIIEQVEPPSQVNPSLSSFLVGLEKQTIQTHKIHSQLVFQNPYRYFMDETNMKRSLKGAAVAIIAAYVFAKVNFCLLRAARGVLTIIGLLTICCLVVEKYESLPEPIILALNTMRINSFDLFQKFYRFVNALNLTRR